MPLPDLVAFDLDGTLWDISKMGDEKTFRSVGINLVRDGDGNELRLGRDLPAILNWLKDNRIPMAISSHNGDPAHARRALDLLIIQRNNGTRVSASSFFGNKNYIEISPAPKKTQLSKLMKLAGVRDGKNVMLYDNDSRNSNVTDLGVVFVLSSGNRLTMKKFNEGMYNFSENYEDDDGSKGDSEDDAEDGNDED